MLDRGGWELRRTGGIAVLRCAALQAVQGVRHGFSTADLDAGSAGDRDAGVLRSRRRFLAAMGLGGAELALPRQVHGASVVDAEVVRGRSVRADAIVLVRDGCRDLAVGVRTADCVPILLVDRRGRALAAIHAGWRGTAQGVVQAAVRWLEAAGVPPGDLEAAVGPAVLGCCYEVGEDVVREVVATSGGREAGLVRREGSDRPHLDLHEANSRQLRVAGVEKTRIHLAPFCTVCTPGRFHSYRRDGSAAGRLLAVVGFSGSAGPSP